MNREAHLELRDRPKNLPMDLVFFETATVHNWVQQLGSVDSQPLAVILSNVPAYRFEVYGLTEDLEGVVLDRARCVQWSTLDFILEDLASRLALRKIIQSLVETPNLYVDEEVLKVIDNRDFSAHQHFKTLWNARFLHEEGHASVPDIVRILSVIPYNSKFSLVERYDTLLMWLTLAKFNSQFERVILPLDCFETAGDRVEETLIFLDALEKWASWGSPLGIMLGFSNRENPFEGFPSPLQERFRKALLT